MSAKAKRAHVSIVHLSVAMLAKTSCCGTKMMRFHPVSPTGCTA